jgi:hypothetical protein
MGRPDEEALTQVIMAFASEYGRYRRPPASVAAARLKVRTQPHLVQPMNLRIKLPRLFAKRWIFFH